MSGSVTPRNGEAAPVRADSGNQYKALQDKLRRLVQAMNSVSGELEALLQRTRDNARRAGQAADQIARAGLDAKYPELTRAVSDALTGADVQVRRLNEMAAQVGSATSEVRATHARLYQQLDNVRSGRKEATPVPGFFAH